MSAWWLTLDALVVLGTAWPVSRALLPRGQGFIGPLLGWGVMFFALVTGTGVLLGAAGWLGWGGFALAHGCAWAAVLTWRGRRLSDDGRELAAMLSAGWSAVQKDRMVFSAAVLLGVFVVTTGVLAGLAEPVVYDALAYRLSRIGHWLQEGRIGWIPGNDPRQNYMPVVPDLVMAWLVGAWSEGFRGAALAQWSGGVLLLLATAGLARQAGLGRAAALGAALLLAGTANVAPQFTTVHTDLLTAGMLTAAFGLWLGAARRGEGSWLAGLGGGLALGAKGTVFYLGPTLLLWAVWLGWRLRLPLVAWRRTVLATIAGAAVFALPGFVRNWQAYGGPFGPREFVAMHHQAAAGQLLQKTGLNLGTSLLQVLEPNSQPPGLQTMARRAGLGLVEAMPQQDPFSYESLNRRETLRAIFQRLEPDADATSFGLLALGLFFAGAVTALWSVRTGAADVRLWSAGAGVFFLFFHAMQQWHPYGFRYFVLVAPWLAVVAAWWLEGLPAGLRRAAWGLALIAAGATGWRALTHTHQAGWQAVTQPGRARNYHVYRQWREWAGGLGRPDEPWQVMMPFNRPLAAFYRVAPPHVVRPQAEAAMDGLTAEQALVKLNGGWLIVPALQFMGREGSVSGSIWLYEGNPESPFSVAAYRRLAVGESEPLLVYRNKIVRDGGKMRHELLVRVVGDGRVVLGFESEKGIRWRFVISTPTEVRRGEWAGGKATQTLTLPVNQAAEMQVVLEPTIAGAGPPRVEIMR